MTEIPVMPVLTGESVKTIGESLGISAIADDVAKEVADDVTFRLKVLIQDGMKFMTHGKRRKFTTHDFDLVLKSKNIEPLYGIQSKEHIPFRFASGGGRELHFIEDKEVDVNDLISSSNPRLPLQISLKPHWLAIEGVQPSIPENPAPVSKDLQKMEAVDPATKLSSQFDARDKKHIHGRGMKSVETIKVKHLATHELSAEQQLYYKEITEACVGSDEPKRGEALDSLKIDPGLHQMVPRLCTFIAEGVRVNVVEKNLALLIYLMRMARSLFDNQTLYLEKYLHELVPSVLTCIVSKQLCNKPDMDNHWALRDFAAKLISQICKKYNTSTNGIQTRITRVFSRCLNTEKTPLSTIYGSIAGLSELGTEVIKVFILPKLLSLNEKLEQCTLEGAVAFEKNAASHIKQLLLKTVVPIIKSVRSPPDNLTDYKTDYGFLLGPLIHAAVVKARQTPVTSALNINTSSIRGVTPAARIIQHGVTGVASRVVMSKPSAISQAGQKVIIMSSRSPTPNQTTASDGGGLLKTVGNSGNSVGTPKVGGPKFVVVSGGPNQAPIKQEIKEEPEDHMLSPQPDLDLL